MYLGRPKWVVVIPHKRCLSQSHTRKSHMCDGSKDTGKSYMFAKASCFFKLMVPLMNAFISKSIFSKTSTKRTLDKN